MNAAVRSISMAAIPRHLQRSGLINVQGNIPPLQTSPRPHDSSDTDSPEANPSLTIPVDTCTASGAATVNILCSCLI